MVPFQIKLFYPGYVLISIQVKRILDHLALLCSYFFHSIIDRIR